MKKLSLRILACALVAAMVIPFVACDKKKPIEKEKTASGKKIAAEDPWYDSTVIRIEPNFKDKDKQVEYASQTLVGYDEKYLAIMLQGYYKMPDAMSESGDYSDYVFNTVSLVDRKTGELVHETNLNEIVKAGSSIERTTYSDGKLTLNVTTFDDINYDVSYKAYEIDPTTGKLLDQKKLDTDTQPEISIFDRTFQLKDYLVIATQDWGDRATATLHFYKSNEKVADVDIKKNDQDIYDIMVLIQLDENKALAAASYPGMGYLFYEIDLQTFKATEVDQSKYDWLDVDNISSTYSGSDGMLYSCCADSILRIDVKNKKTEKFINFSDCTVNRTLLSYSRIIECDGNSVILGNETYNNSSTGGSTIGIYTLVSLTKAPTNPHAGDTILELFVSGGWLTKSQSDAVNKYNESNTGYYITVADRYSASTANIDYSNVQSEDDIENTELQYNSVLSNELAVDLMNGEGPDILLNCSSYGQLNNSNYLVDLSKYVGTLDSDNYFTNVIDGCRTNGKLYQLPVSFMVKGIHTDAKYAGKSGVGFTTEEYAKFLNEQLNGSDVLPYGQAQYFTKLFTAESELFIKDGKVDFSTPEFKALAEYVKNNVKESATNWNDISVGGYSGGAVGTVIVKGDTNAGNSVAINSYCYGVGGYLEEVFELHGATAILGFPSSDGRGPLISPYCSIAISAQAQNVDACGEFVKLLISDEFQTTLAENDEFPINRNVFRKVGKEVLDYKNSPECDAIFSYDPQTGANSKRYVFKEEAITDLENIILSCSRVDATDGAINMILIEEMPAYFSGQKDLDAVIKIAQDRVQKVVSERG